jgi:hypothetical protein
MKRIAAAMVLALLVLWGGFTMFSLWGDNYKKIVPDVVLQPDELDWQMLAGRGAKHGEYWAILGTGLRGYSRIGISLPWPRSAREFERVEVRFGQGMVNRPAGFGWSGSTTFSPRQVIPLEIDSRNVGTINASWLDPSEGEITFLVIEVFGMADDPLRIESVRLVPARLDFVELQRRLVSEWLAFPPWTQRNTNYTPASLQPVMVSPVGAVAAWVMLAVLLAWIFGRFSARGFVLSLLVACCTGWLALDLRWQADLAHKSVRSVEAFGGEPWKERRAAEFDGQLFEFIEGLKHALGPDHRRVFALGFGEYWRLRARYHALPWSTRSTERPLRNDWTQHLQSGDLVLLLDTPHVEEVSSNFEAGEVRVFEKNLEPAEMIGRGAVLEDAGSRPIVATPPGRHELIRATIDDAPSRAVYRATVRLRAREVGTPARLVVRWRDRQDQTVTATDRLQEVSSGQFDRYSATFALPEPQNVSIFVVDEEGRGLQAEAMRIELLQDENLVWLKSDERGPYLAVRPILDDGVNRAYEVL